MDLSLYRVTASQSRRIKTPTGYVTALHGFVAYRGFATAACEQDAIDSTVAYSIPPGTKYDSIRAEFVRKA